MCLYLNASTFVTSDGDFRGKFLALLDNPSAGAHLAAEVKEARESGISMVMLHENDPARGGCAFDRFFYSTPDELIDAGLFNDIAIALFSAPEEVDVARAFAFKVFSKSGLADVTEDANASKFKKKFRRLSSRPPMRSRQLFTRSRQLSTLPKRTWTWTWRPPTPPTIRQRRRRRRRTRYLQRRRPRRRRPQRRRPRRWLASRLRS